MKKAQSPGIPFCPTCGGKGYHTRAKSRLRILSYWDELMRRPCWCVRFSTVPAQKLMHWMDEKGDGPGTLTYAVKRLLVKKELAPNDVERIKWYFGQWLNVAEPPEDRATWWQTELTECNDSSRLRGFLAKIVKAGVDPI